MKQVTQNYQTGALSVTEVASPAPANGRLLVATTSSLISAGTERTKIETARMSLVEKALSRMDLVKTVVSNIKQEGLAFTLKKAFNKLDSPITLGYSCAGKVAVPGDGTSAFRAGDRVACIGENYATHAELNSVPHGFAARIPDGVDDEEAAFVGLGAIALNAVEVAQVRENESVAVIGLGLLGQIVVQILKARKCRVMGIEIDEEKLLLAKRHGADACADPLKDDVQSMVREFSLGQGADAVIVTAASRNNLPLDLAGKIARNKGRVILVGAMPIVLPRKEYYEKELYFVIARGFGADLYYPLEEGRTYPYNYVPASMQENMRRFLDLLSEKKASIKPLITHRFKLEDAGKAYELIRTGRERYLGILFTYRTVPETAARKLPVRPRPAGEGPKKPLKIGFIGAGSFAQGYLLPALRRNERVSLTGVATGTGINAESAARKFGFAYHSTDYREILNDPETDCVFILTRHNLHAPQVIESLSKGKKVFVEKPLCMNERELRDIIAACPSPSATPMVGFNRRFSPFIRATREFFGNRAAPLMINYRVNAGYLPPAHWVHDTREGGGRIIGEMCHFIDLLQFLAGSLPVEISAVALDHPDRSIPREDNVVVTIRFGDGSVGSVNYNSTGDVSFPRERLEVFGENSVAVVDNYTTAVFTRAGVSRSMKRWGRDMGHDDEIRSFVRGQCQGEPPLIPLRELAATSLATFRAKESLEKGTPVSVQIPEWVP